MDSYFYLLVVEFAFAGLVFLMLFFISAPYGKFLRKGWGLSLPAKYSWLIMELPAVLFISFYFYISKGWENPVLIIFYVIWQSHYLFRTFVYPFTMGGKNKPYPFILVIFAIVFNSLNGSINGHFIFQANEYSSDWLLSPAFIGGFTLFIIGYAINKQSDFILKNLRKKSDTYTIPYGGLFKWISNPHYFGEILQWLGWAILTWSTAGFAFACFTFANLFPRAISNHKWYKEQFDNYPRRKAIIPFIV